MRIQGLLEYGHKNKSSQGLPKNIKSHFQQCSISLLSRSFKKTGKLSHVYMEELKALKIKGEVLWEFCPRNLLENLNTLGSLNKGMNSVCERIP